MYSRSFSKSRPLPTCRCAWMPNRAAIQKQRGQVFPFVEQIRIDANFRLHRQRRCAPTRNPAAKRLSTNAGLEIVTPALERRARPGTAGTMRFAPAKSTSRSSCRRFDFARPAPAPTRSCVLSLPIIANPQFQFRVAVLGHARDGAAARRPIPAKLSARHNGVGHRDQRKRADEQQRNRRPSPGTTAPSSANGNTIAATQNNNLERGTIIAARRFVAEFAG